MTSNSFPAASARIALAVLVLVTSAAQQLSAQPTSVITGTVTNALTGGPVANASVRVVGTPRVVVTGADGTYRLPPVAGQSEVRVTRVGFSPASQTISASGNASVVIDFKLHPSAVQLDEVVAVGTRVLDRTTLSSPVPVDVISGELLANTGMMETWQQLQRVIPSINIPHIPLGDNHMRPVTLRGLTPSHVLVLLNGKRRHPASVLLAGPSVPSAALTDLNAIPSGAIERIEVLRDGAAAQYGSDAIGGVVNVILKSGKRRDFGTSFGGVYSTEAGRDFRDGKLFEANTTLGFSASNGAHVTLTGELRNRDGTNRAYPDRRPQYFTGDARNNQPARVSSYLGNGEVDALGAFLSAASPITGGIEAYAFGGLTDRNSVSPDAFFRRPLDARTVRAIHPDGFLPEIGSDIRDVSVLGGLRGQFLNWRWDVSSAWGDNTTAYDVYNSNNASLGAASPTDFYAGKVSAQQWTSNADISRDLKIGSLTVGIAGGAEFRIDRYNIRAGDPDSWRDGGVRIPDGPQAGQRAQVGAQGFFGFRPIDEVYARRSNSALYFEAETRPIHRLLLQSAVRAERYSDFGSTSDGKLAAHMQVLPQLAVRASTSSGFRAPALTQQFFSSTRTVLQLINGTSTVLTVRTFPVNTPEAQLMGATPLRPETSVNHSAGIVLNVPRWPRVTADVYRITIADRIALGGSVTDTSIIRLFEQNGMTGIGGGSYFRNSTDTRTQGIDIVSNHAFLLNRSHVLRMSAAYNHNRTAVTRVIPYPPQLARFGSQVFSRTGRGVIERGQPRQTIMLTLNYDAGPVGINLHNQRSGPTAQLDQNTPSADQIVTAKLITDARLSYQLNRRLQVAISGANLFDVYPDEWWDFKDGLNAQGVSMQGIFKHPGALSPFGMTGRTLFVQLSYR